MIDVIENRVRLLEIEQARQEVQMDSLKIVLAENTQAIKELTDVLNKSKGAWWALGGIAAMVAYLFDAVATWIKH